MIFGPIYYITLLSILVAIVGKYNESKVNREWSQAIDSFEKPVNYYQMPNPDAVC